MTGKLRPIVLWLAGLLTAAGCSTQAPKGVEPVRNFELERYLGDWYEIARLDHRFERDLTAVRARYSKAEDGGIEVVNLGYNTEKSRWKAAQGRAQLVQSPDIGHLKVSFFGPFYSPYVIFTLDQDDYQYAFISGGDREYLWLLARTPDVSADLKQRFEREAEALGFDLSELQYISHAGVPAPPPNFQPED